MSRLFGWDLPPGVSQRDIDNAYGQDYDPTPESEQVAEIFNEMHGGATEVAKGEEAILEFIDNLAMQLHEARGFLQSTLTHLPARGPEPPCTCKDNEWGWCDLHSADWHQETLKEEIEHFLIRTGKDPVIGK